MDESNTVEEEGGEGGAGGYGAAGDGEGSHWEMDTQSVRSRYAFYQQRPCLRTKYDVWVGRNAQAPKTHGCSGSPWERVSRSLIWSLWGKGRRSILVSAAQRTSLPVTAGQVSAGGEAAAMQREREREEERNGGVPVVQLSLLSPLQNICPSNMAEASLSPREVACPAQDGQSKGQVFREDKERKRRDGGQESQIDTAELSGQQTGDRVQGRARPLILSLGRPRCSSTGQCQVWFICRGQRAPWSCHGPPATQEELPFSPHRYPQGTWTGGRIMWSGG
ncbi:hypothetical protein PAMP_021186 [Pampus punctatissimus]